MTSHIAAGLTNGAGLQAALSVILSEANEQFSLKLWIYHLLSSTSKLSKLCWVLGVGTQGGIRLASQSMWDGRWDCGGRC